MLEKKSTTITFYSSEYNRNYNIVVSTLSQRVQVDYDGDTWILDTEIARKLADAIKQMCDKEN